MTNWRRVLFAAETVAGKSTLHRGENLGETPIETTGYARDCGVIAYRDTESGDVAFYIEQQEGER